MVVLFLFFLVPLVGIIFQDKYHRKLEAKNRKNSFYEEIMYKIEIEVNTDLRNFKDIHSSIEEACKHFSTTNMNLEYSIVDKEITIKLFDRKAKLTKKYIFTFSEGILERKD